MSYATALDASRLSVLLDLRHPLAYLALQPAIEFGRRLQIGINWLPLDAAPLNAPSEPGPDDDRGILHRRHRARMIAREIETYARVQGLELREPYRDGDASAANLAWLWVREHEPRRLEALLVEMFRGYWSWALDPSDPRALAPLVSAAADEAERFQRWAEEEGPVEAQRIASELAGRGFGGVPGYLVDGEFFLGRQHLPMIQWILEGRAGPGPI